MRHRSRAVRGRDSVEGELEPTTAARGTQKGTQSPRQNAYTDGTQTDAMRSRNEAERDAKMRPCPYLAGKGSGVRIPDAPPLRVELKIGSQRQRVPTSGLKIDPLPGQGVTGVLNWALNIQIPRTLVNRRTRARHRGTHALAARERNLPIVSYRCPIARTGEPSGCLSGKWQSHARRGSVRPRLCRERRPGRAGDGCLCRPHRTMPEAAAGAARRWWPGRYSLLGEPRHLSM